MFQQVDYIMITVSNMAQSIEFYRDKLGLQLKFESPEWTEFVTGPTTLALHGGGVHSGDKLLNKEKAAGKCTIGFNVPNLDATYSELKSRGVHFVMEPQAREGEPIRLAVAIDPDGVEVTFAQYIKKP